MMTAFERAWAFLMEAEGGSQFTDDPHDPGGATKFGISQRAYPNEDIRNMTEARAKQLFLVDYWNPCQCERLPEPLAIALADSAFNQGVVAAIRLLQRALNVPADGIMGRITLAAAVRASTPEHLNEFLSRRLMRYADGKSGYRHGWFLRVLRLKDAIA